MANEFKVRKGLIVQGSGSNIFDVQGSQGQLFSVTDSLSGSLFSVNDISGIPIMEVFSDNTIKLGTFNQEAIIVSGSRTGMGIATPQAKLHISGANNDSLFRIQSPASASIMFVSGSGLVGIGTATPTQKISVDTGNVGFTSGFGISWDSDTEWIRRAAASDQLQLATQNTVRLNIGSTQGQLVAIGLGATAASAQFQVRGGGATSATTAMRIEDSGGNARLTILDDGTSAFNTSHLYVSSSGRIGIGTTTPQRELDVNGSVRLGTIFKNGGGSNLSFLSDGSGAVTLNIGGAIIGTLYDSTPNFNEIRTSNNQNLSINARGSGSLFLQTVDATRLTITGSNVGIGTTTPTNTLQVVGGITATSITASIISASSGITGSLFGTSSWATNALTASNITPSITNNTDNRVLTATGGGTINGESNLTFDGSVLTVTGIANISTSITSSTANIGFGAGSALNAGQTTIRGSGIDTAGALTIQNVGGTAVFTVLNGGTTGVGENNPSARLHVKGSGATSATTALRVENSSAAARLTILDDGTSAFNTSHLYVSSSGNVGIGLTSPLARLHISGANALRMQNTGFDTFEWFFSAGTGIGFRNVTDGTTPFFVGGTDDIGIGTTNTSARLHVSGASDSNLLRVGSPAQANILFITGSGNIGVGTTTPGVELDVVGNIRASSTMFNTTTQTRQITINSANQIQFFSASVETARYDNNGWGFFNTTPTARVHISGANADNLFRVSSPTQANALFVSGSGNVGIGTNLPSADLHISGASVDSLLRVGSPTNANILFVTGSGNIGINTTSSRAFFSGSGGFFGSGEGNIVPTLTIFQSSSATGLNAAGLQIVGSGSSAFAAARLNILTMGDKYAYLNIGTSGSGTENNYWEFTKASSTYAHTLYLSNYSNGVFQSNIMALVPGANTSTIGTNNQIFLEGSTGYIGLQTSNTGTQEWIHLYSAPDSGEYIRIDAAQTSNSPPLTAATAKNGYGIVANNNYLAEPDYWMEIKLAANVVLIPCYLPA